MTTNKSSVLLSVFMAIRAIKSCPSEKRGSLWRDLQRVGYSLLSSTLILGIYEWVDRSRNVRKVLQGSFCFLRFFTTGLHSTCSVTVPPNILPDPPSCIPNPQHFRRRAHSRLFHPSSLPLGR